MGKRRLESLIRLVKYIYMSPSLNCCCCYHRCCCYFTRLICFDNYFDSHVSLRYVCSCCIFFFSSAFCCSFERHSIHLKHSRHRHTHNHTKSYLTYFFHLIPIVYHLVGKKIKALNRATHITEEFKLKIYCVMLSVCLCARVKMKAIDYSTPAAAAKRRRRRNMLGGGEGSERKIQMRETNHMHVEIALGHEKCVFFL